MPISQSLHHQPHGLLQQVQRQWNTWLLLVAAVDLSVVEVLVDLEQVLAIQLLLEIHILSQLVLVVMVVDQQAAH
jgi:hypothetical protein